MADALDARVDSLYRVVKGRVRWDNLVPTCLDLAQELEQMTELRGSDRLKLLQTTLRHALKESDLSNDEKEKVLFTIDTILPIVMQAAILASKSPIVRKVQESCCSFWTKK